MKSTSSAPGKVILFGEHFVVYGKKAVLCAIDRRIEVTAQTTANNSITIRSDIGDLTSPANAESSDIDLSLRPLFHLAKNSIQRNGHAGGISIRVKSDIPSGVGLGSSSACCVAGASAVSSLFEKLDRDEILRLAIDAEKTVHPDSSGADCTACMHGGIMVYSKDGFARLNQSPDFKLVIANSNMEHSTSAMVSGVRQFMEKHKARFSSMCDAQDRLTDRALFLLEKNDLAGLGQCMRKNQELLEEMGVSNDTLGAMAAAANETSFGSKITGAGGGGCILALDDNDGVLRTTTHLNKKGIECFSAGIDFKGLDTF